MALYVSALNGGTNNHPTTSEEANGYATDFVTEGVVGSISNTNSVAPMTGAFAVNAQGTPDMTVAVTSGIAYVTATPSGQSSQSLRVRLSANQNVTISANSSGSTKYDWLYVKVDPTNANNPNLAGDDVATLVTSRSTSNSSDDGTPPTYGLNIAIVTVSNGASSITNGNIRDTRVMASQIQDAEVSNVKFSQFQPSEIVSDFIYSGGVVAQSAGLVGTFSNIVYYIGGVRYTATSVANKTYTASKDTYVDINTSGTVTYTEVANNAASPALSASNIRVAIVTTNGSAITNVNKGEENQVIPIASSIPYAVTDSQGNLICPRDPHRRILGYRRITSNATTSSTTVVQVAGLSVPVIVPTGRKIKISAIAPEMANATTGNNMFIEIWDGTVGSGTRLTYATNYISAGGFLSVNAKAEAIVTPATSSKTYNLGIKVGAAGSGTLTATSTSPAYLLVELV